MTVEQVLQALISMCRDHDIVPGDRAINDDDDMFEYGMIDSMGLTLLSFAIEEHFNLPVTQDMLVAELRTPRAIAEYIVEYASGNNTVAVTA
ncbi:MAG: acyl carrier protein [Gammaproteobacteria bacterium]|jgi:acyl carrier protein